MTAQEIAQQINSVYGPKFQELGVDAFILAAYVTDSSGKVARIVVGNVGQHPAFADGIRPMVHVATRWEAGQL